MSSGSRELPDSLEGHFLISEADLVDPNFRRTVVLIIHHNEEGAFGLVVNRRTEVTLSDVLPDLGGSQSGGIPLFIGGPVQPRYLFCLHSGLPQSLESEHSSHPLEHVVFEPDFGSLTEYLKGEWSGLSERDRPTVRAYAGYAGWAAGQLESELERGAWVVRPAAAKHIFHPNPEEGWREALGELGGFNKIVADTGFKPSMN
jgi:putative transcriptional regulator